MATYNPAQQLAVRVHELEYRNDGNEPWMVTIHQPQGDGPFPALLDVHGGAWNRGDRSADEGDEPGVGRQRHRRGGDRLPAGPGASLSGAGAGREPCHPLAEGPRRRVQRRPVHHRGNGLLQRRPYVDAQCHAAQRLPLCGTGFARIVRPGCDRGPTPSAAGRCSTPTRGTCTPRNPTSAWPLPVRPTS